MERDFSRYTPENIEIHSSNFTTTEEDFSPLPPAVQSGRSKHHGKSSRGNHRSGLRGKGREAFSRNNWMKNVI